MDEAKVVTSPSFSLDKSGLKSVLRHIFLPLAAQGVIEALQAADLTHLSPGMYIIASSAVQGAIQFLNKFLGEHKSVVVK